MQAIAAEAVLAPPGPDGAAHVPVRCPGICQCLVQAAGLRAVAEWHVGVQLVTDSPRRNIWEKRSASSRSFGVCRGRGPARSGSRSCIARASTDEQDGKVRIPGVARCIAASKPRRLRSIRVSISRPSATSATYRASRKASESDQ